MDSNDSVESDVSTGEMRAETREILVQDNRPFLYFSLNEVLEEFSYEFIVDAVREMLRAQVLLPEEGFDNHTEWWNFGNAAAVLIALWRGPYFFEYWSLFDVVWNERRTRRAACTPWRAWWPMCRSIFEWERCVYCIWLPAHTCGRVRP